MCHNSERYAQLSFAEVMALDSEDYEAYQEYLDGLKSEELKVEEAEKWYNLGGQSLKD